MIRPEDFDFHTAEDSPWNWTETLALPFALPEHKINAIIYLVMRPKVGACMSDITLVDRISDLWEDQLYVDNMQHLPCPETLTKFDLPNGLSFEVIEPLKLFRLRYQGIDDTHFALEYRALHAPYDINDPDIDPTAAARGGHDWAVAWGGHYEQTYRITGSLTVRGKHYDVDCVETGDRSWGPRFERENGTMIWWHASFGEALTIHLFTPHDIATTDAFGTLMSGYVLEDGDLHGLVSCSGRQDYRGAMPMGGELQVTDERGKTFDLTFSTVNGCYWAPCPSNTYLQSSFRVACGGRIGNGVAQLGLSRAYLTRHRDAIKARY